MTWTLANQISFHSQPEPVDSGGKLYDVIKGHTTQADWTPDISSSLFVEIHQPEADLLYPEWVQPTSTNYYNKGDRMTYTDGYYYESTIDVNTYSPAEYPQGWEQIGAI